MDQTKPSAPASQAKKPWITPAIQSIPLNAAKNGVFNHGDGGGGGTGKS